MISKGMVRLVGATLALVVIYACTSQGTIVNPFERRLVWFSHISGEDVRAACTPETPDRYRLTYYANRALQVRVYELNVPPRNKDGDIVSPSDGAGIPDTPIPASVDVLEGAIDFTRLPLIEDVLRPWRPKSGDFTLPADVMREIRFDMIQGGLLKEVEDGRALASPSYFWLAAVCMDGQFHFQVWEYPDQAFAQLSFPAALFGRDESPVPARLPPNSTERIVNYVNPTKQQLIHPDNYTHYDLIISKTGVSPGREYPLR